MKTVTVYLVRHGQTYLNKYGKMQGWSDAPLTEQGAADAHETGKRFADTAFDAVYVSDLGRTKATAEIICDENKHVDKADIKPRMGWRESSFGALDGSFNDYVYGKVAAYKGVEVQDLFKEVGLDELSEAIKEIDPAHAAETNAEVRARVNAALQDVVDESEDGAHVLVVTHGNVIRILVSAIDPSIEVRRELKNSGVTTVRFENGKASIAGFNE